MICKVSAFNTYCVDLADIFSYSHQSGHGAERLSEIIRIQTCDDNPDTTVGEGLTHLNQLISEELGFVDTYYFDVCRNLEHMFRIADRGRLDAVEVVGDNLYI